MILSRVYNPSLFNGLKTNQNDITTNAKDKYPFFGILAGDQTQ